MVTPELPSLDALMKILDDEPFILERIESKVATHANPLGTRELFFDKKSPLTSVEEPIFLGMRQFCARNKAARIRVW
jgi:hypothetical protein